MGSLRNTGLAPASSPSLTRALPLAPPHHSQPPPSSKALGVLAPGENADDPVTSTQACPKQRPHPSSQQQENWDSVCLQEKEVGTITVH